MITAQQLPPPLKWAGGKRWLVPKLQEIWSANGHRRLVEPFCGGLAVALGLQPERALLNDLNSHLINFYRQLARGLDCNEAPFINEQEIYYQNRQRFNQLIAQDQAESAEAAQLFYYLNRTGYNGLCRFNRQGLFNVPFGRHKTINYQRDFSEYKSVLSSWELRRGSFRELEIDAEKDFIYADPPYDVPFVDYAGTGFTWADQVQLAQWLSQQRCPVIASNQATSRIIALYREYGFQLEELAAPRSISCTGDRQKCLEILAYKGL